MDDLRDYFLLNEKPNITIGVNLKIEKLMKAVDWITGENPVTSISVNKEISKLLIGKPTENFSKVIVDWFSRQVKEAKGKPILITDIEILFEPSLELDTLIIFKQLGRKTALLVMWTGEYKNKVLSYASPEHAHYRTWADPGVEIIQV